jgi:hypothetical protein
MVLGDRVMILDIIINMKSSNMDFRGTPFRSKLAAERSERPHIVFLRRSLFMAETPTS